MRSQDRHAALRRYQPIVLLLQRARLFFGRGHDRLEPKQDLAMLGVSTEARQAGLDVGKMARCILGPRLDGEDGVGISGSEVSPFARGPRLQDRRSVLRRTHYVERPARLEETPDMLDAVDLARIGEHRPLAIHDEGIRFPARPKLAANLHVLVRAVIASIGVWTISTEIGIEVAVDRGDHVPARAAAGQVIDGGPQARSIERMAVAG